MECELIKECIGKSSLEIWASAITAGTAIIAAASAFQSFLLSKKMYEEIKSDEEIIAGPLHRVGLNQREHDKSVLRLTLFNKSKRKAYVDSVTAFDKKDNKIEITWSDDCDQLGNIIKPTELLGVNDSVNVVLRRNDGEEFDECTVYIKHSLDSSLVSVHFNAYKLQQG